MKAKLKSMKGFRNIIIHRYGWIDDRLAFGFLNENLQDFDDFITKITAYLNKHGK